MIISRTTRLVVRPRDYESITLEATVSHDFGDTYDEELASATIQRVLDAALEADVNEAVACASEPSFIDNWKVEVYGDNAASGS